MKNIFEVSLESHYQFEWDKLGNIKKGREHLGEEMPVLVYRLLEYSMNDVLFKMKFLDKLVILQDVNLRKMHCLLMLMKVHL